MNFLFFEIKVILANIREFISSHLTINDNFMLGFIYTICGTSTTGLMFISTISTKEAIQTISASFALIPAIGMCFLFLVNKYSELKEAAKKVKRGFKKLWNKYF
jgi:hypothetical protein